jgi:hypothetical protein
MGAATPSTVGETPAEGVRRRLGAAAAASGS